MIFKNSRTNAWVYAYTGGKSFESKLPCVVFIHGAVNDHSVWVLQARAFAHHGYCVLALDLPGHGRSTDELPETIESAGQWVLDILSDMHISQASLVGHSMGSLIALEAAAQSKEKSTNLAITHLVMVGTTYPMKVSPALLETSEKDPLEAVEKVVAWSINGLGPKPSAPGPGSWLRGGSRALMRRVIALDAKKQLDGTKPVDQQDRAVQRRNIFAHDFSLCNQYARGLKAAESIASNADTRVSFILGSQDQMTPARSASELSNALNAQVFTLNSGHSLMGEAPTQFTQTLRRAVVDFV